MHVKIGFAAVVLSVPLAFVLPPKVAFENGAIENAQVVILLALAAANVKWSLAAANIRQRWFHRFCAALTFLFALRELSWGRVFFQIGTAANGAPHFISMADYPLRLPVYIFLTLYILALVFILFRFLPVKRMLLSKKPLGALAVMFAAVAMVYIGEHGYIFGKECGEILEELNETIAYLMMPYICTYYRKFLKS